jgi:hypothetical protein
MASQNSHHTNKRIAGEIGVNHATVGKKREEMEAVCQIDKLDKHEGKDGKLYSRAKPKRTAPKTKPAEEPEDTMPPHAEMYGVPGWVGGGEQEVSIIRRSCSEGRGDCAQGAHLSHAALSQRCRTSTADVAAESAYPACSVICGVHSSAT